MSDYKDSDDFQLLCEFCASNDIKLSVKEGGLKLWADCPEGKIFRREGTTNPEILAREMLRDLWIHYHVKNAYTDFMKKVRNNL